MSRSVLFLAAALMLGFVARGVMAQAGPAPDFPPGMFSDGGHYDLAEFQGKILVLFLYEKDCPTCRGTIPDRNKLVESMKDLPVKFIAISPHAMPVEAKAYVRETKLAMPVYADTFGLMQKRYHEAISLENIYQFKVIGPSGTIVGEYVQNLSGLKSIVEHTKWKYKDDGYDPQLAHAILLLEWNQYPAGMRELKPFLKSGKKDLAASAQKLFDAVKTEAATWKTEADAAVDTDPVKAFDLYTKLSAAFPGDELGTVADAALKKLKVAKPVQNELAARVMYARLDDAFAKATPKQKSDLANYCDSITKSYPESPTGKKAASLATEIRATDTP